MLSVGFCSTFEGKVILISEIYYVKGFDSID